MNTAIEATYNINATPQPTFPLLLALFIQLFFPPPPLLLVVRLFVVQNGHISSIISWLIGLADELPAFAPTFGDEYKCANGVRGGLGRVWKKGALSLAAEFTLLREYKIPSGSPRRTIFFLVRDLVARLLVAAEGPRGLCGL